MVYRPAPHPFLIKILNTVGRTNRASENKGVTRHLNISYMGPANAWHYDVVHKQNEFKRPQTAIYKT